MQVLEPKKELCLILDILACPLAPAHRGGMSCILAGMRMLVRLACKSNCVEEAAAVRQQLDAPNAKYFWRFSSGIDLKNIRTFIFRFIYNIC